MGWNSARKIIIIITCYKNIEKNKIHRKVSVHEVKPKNLSVTKYIKVECEKCFSFVVLINYLSSHIFITNYFLNNYNQNEYLIKGKLIKKINN